MGAVGRLLGVLLLSGCAGCPAGLRPVLAAELLFGGVDEAAFADFLDRSVTPRFPAGLTVLDAAGRWRSRDGRMVQERSKRVLIVADSGAGTMAGLEAIRGEYKRRFGQESVGLMLAKVCAGF